jgi:hypothetical protein
MKAANYLKYGIGFFSEQNVEIHLIQCSSLNVTAALHCIALYFSDVIDVLATLVT